MLDFRFLNQIVRVQPAKNRDQTEELDRYWLDIMIKRADIWSKIWKKLDVQDVDININVSLDRCFTPLIPPDLAEQIEITHKFLEAGRSTDRSKMSQAWWEYRRKMRKQVLTGETIFNIGRKLLEPDTFPSYLEVDPPYRIGKVHSLPQLQTQSLPNFISVTTQTDLNYKQHFARGYLNFKKKLFIDIIREEIEKIS